MSKENVKQTKTQTQIIQLKAEHSASMLEYKGEQICLENASPEILQDLYENELWKYLFE